MKVNIVPTGYHSVVTTVPLSTWHVPAQSGYIEGVVGIFPVYQNLFMTAIPLQIIFQGDNPAGSVTADIGVFPKEGQVALDADYFAANVSVTTGNYTPLPQSDDIANKTIRQGLLDNNGQDPALEFAPSTQWRLGVTLTSAADSQAAFSIKVWLTLGDSGELKLTQTYPYNYRVPIQY
jgi:hypothetical protein